MTETGGTGASGTTVHEAYSFACMNCGYGWEQTYDIEHRTGPDGKPLITYWADGRRVPSPLTHPTCPNCEGHKLRIMRSGRVATAVDAWQHH
ncbi:hypothetical protein RM572_27710 [Streptomyces sp. DSM 42041]|uniref:Small CPxCG-related zinc finger protein n=1 Tax=Streptomyces hazeniae TaxID=3075538 RepID=A0ABU2P0L8_9ACTN|nr:hypothetical protein [Streptomyces sp. DSM 42041]MDT0382549.1 hypothetical protein [Streptomyces sp. DSM 42041]